MTVPAARIREAVGLINESVRISLDRVRATRDAVRANPSAYTKSAITRSERGWTRVVIEETIWSVAKQGLLASPEQAAVVKAAEQWAKSWDQTPSSEMEPEDKALYEAVQTLVATLDPDQLDEVAVG